MTTRRTHNPLTDAEPVRQHIHALMAAGISLKRTAAAASVRQSCLNGILYSRGNRPRAEQIEQDNAHRILAVRPERVEPGRANATGTRRRIQALMAIGWPQLQIAPHAGLHPHYITEILRTRRVYASTVHAVAIAYDHLWDKNPLHYGVRPQAATRVRNYAKANGWAPPAAWDDEGIDDPAAKPHVGDDSELDRAALAALRRDEIAHLAGFGISDHEIAGRLSMAASSVRAIIADLHGAPKRNRAGAAA